MPHRLPAVVLAVALLLAGCSAAAEEEPESAAPASSEEASTSRMVQPGAPGEGSRELSEEEIAELDLDVEHTEADVAFMQDMMAHHVQALRMTRLVDDRTSREDVPLFAERIDLAQEEEIDLIRNWLEARDEEVPSLLGDHAHGGHGDDDGEPMPGMLTEEEFEQLEAAEGEEFDRLFLQAMIYHHDGAIQMVHELYAADGGVEPELRTFANHVASDQEIEIGRAQEMLADIDEGRSNAS
jgi:uncharacterized protein (DUF305 family)